MRCIICNAILTDDEATLKDVDGFGYMDTCFNCLDTEEATEDFLVYVEDLDDTAYASAFIVKNCKEDEDGNKLLDSDEF